MSMFNLKSKNQKQQPEKLNEELYGKAWLLIVSNSKKEQGLKIMNELHKKGFVEATVVLSMFENNNNKRKQLVKMVADAKNPEGMWQYACVLPHSFCPNSDDREDALWEEYCLNAARNGSVDAMNEMGNIFNRRDNFAESMYWYSMANAHGQLDGQVSMEGIAKRWTDNGCPYDYVKGSKDFDNARFKCAITYLEIHANMEMSIKIDELISYVLLGVPIAAYLTGDIFESNENYEMAYKMYNAISFENDPHGLRCYADMVFSGRGIKQDIKAAIKTYELSAKLGDREAMFITGQFLQKDNKYMAAYWYGLSHTRGYQDSLSRLVQLSKALQ